MYNYDNMSYDKLSQGVNMIKQTFHNLSEDKKTRIINAIKDEFNSVSIDKISINRIIKKAEISRGSFYQYFDDKSDLYEIIAIEVTDCIKTMFIESLLKNKGDIFDTFRDMFCNILEEFLSSDKKRIIRKHLYEYIPVDSSNARTILDHMKNKLEENKELFIRNINTAGFIDNSYEYVEDVFDLVISVFRELIFEFKTDSRTSEEIISEYDRKISIIQRGCLR